MSHSAASGLAECDCVSEICLVMTVGRCSHSWDMANVVSGLIIMKKCYRCGKVSSCFSLDKDPPLESCHEEPHYWNFMEAIPALHFDLKCSKCGTEIKLDEMVGLMVCTGCDDKCEVNLLTEKLKAENTQVFIALEPRPIDERKQLAPEKFAAVEQYFENKSSILKRHIKIVPQEMVRNIATCDANAVSDI